MRRVPKGERGVTLVELLVASLLAAIVLTGAWWMFLSGSRQSVKLDVRLRRVQSVVDLLEHLSDDMAQAVVVPPEGSEGNAADGPQLTLYRFRRYVLEPAQPAGDTEPRHAVRTEPVVYRFDAATGLLSRNGRPLPLGKFSSVKFHPPGNIVAGVQVKVSAEGEPAGAPGVAAGRPGEQYQFLLPLERAAAEAAFDSWQENYFDLEPSAGE